MIVFVAVYLLVCLVAWSRLVCLVLVVLFLICCFLVAYRVVWVCWDWWFGALVRLANYCVMRVTAGGCSHWC